MRLENFILESTPEEDEKKKEKQQEKVRKASKATLTKGLRKLEDHIDAFSDEIEKEIDKIEDNPTFKQHMSLMFTNSEKESSELSIALRQIISTLGKKASVIPQVRGHSKGSIPEPNEDDKEDVRDEVDDSKKEEEDEE